MIHRLIRRYAGVSTALLLEPEPYSVLELGLGRENQF